MFKQGYQETKQVIIEDDVWIGARSVILPGIKIRTGSIIAVGNVVTKDVEPFSIVAGVPAKLVKKRK
jgi:maltose O-acetyltransferase